MEIGESAVAANHSRRSHWLTRPALLSSGTQPFHEFGHVAILRQTSTPDSPGFSHSAIDSSPTLAAKE